MIGKQELLKILKNALDAEEKAIPIYAKHLETAVFWTGINKDNIKKAKDLLKQLANETDNHKNIIINLIKKIREDKNNAF